jgi:hypothetical protein
MRIGTLLHCSSHLFDTETSGLHPVGETPKLETGWPNAGLRQLRVNRYKQRSGEAEAGSAGEQPAEE